MKFKVENIVPLGNDIIISANKESVTKSGLIVPDSLTITPVQEVLAIGKYVRDVEVGDMVEVNPLSFPTEKTLPKNGIGADLESPIIPLFEDVDNTPFMKVRENNLLWIIKE